MTAASASVALATSSSEGTGGPAGLPAPVAIGCLRQQYSQPERPAWEVA